MKLHAGFILLSERKTKISFNLVLWRRRWISEKERVLVLVYFFSVDFFLLGMELAPCSVSWKREKSLLLLVLVLLVLLFSRKIEFHKSRKSCTSLGNYSFDPWRYMGKKMKKMKIKQFYCRGKCCYKREWIQNHVYRLFSQVLKISRTFNILY